MDGETGHRRSVFSLRALTAAILGALVVLGSFFASPVLLGRIPIHGDLSCFNLPIRAFYAKCLANGDAVDWMPECFGGFFVTGEGQHGPYHPLHWLLYRWLPLDTAFALEVFLPILVLLLGTIIFLRRYVDFTAACLGALMATFSAMFIEHLQHPQIAMVLAHVPWLLAAIDETVRAATAARRRLAFLAVALLVGSQILLGHPQATWISLLTCATFGGFLLVVQRSDWFRWLATAGGFLLGIGLGSAQLFPTYDYFLSSDRAAKGVDVFHPAITRTSFVENIAPCRIGMGFTMFPNYVGCVALVLTLWWLTACWSRHSDIPTKDCGKAAYLRSEKKRWSPIQQLSVWAVLTTIVMAVLAMGREGGLYRLLTLLPVIGGFRGPGRYLIVTQFCVAMIAAIAFAHLLALSRNSPKPAWRHLALPWLATAASIVVAAYFYATRPADVFAGRDFRWQYYAGPILIGSATIALTLAARGRRVGLLMLALLAAIDMGIYNVDTEMGRTYWHNLPSCQEFLATLRSDKIPDSRFCAPPPSCEGRICQEFVNKGDWFTHVNRQSLTGHRVINGYAAMSPVRKLDYRDVHALRVAGVAWYWQPRHEPFRLTGVPPIPEGAWGAIPNPLPRQRLVAKAEVSRDPFNDLKNIDVDTTALVTHSLFLSSSTPGRAELINDRPGKIWIDVETPARQLLVLSESYSPDWQVRIDGQPATVERVNGDFQGCLVNAGKHRVEFTFDSPSVRFGRNISLASLAFVFGAAFFPAGTGLRRRTAGASSQSFTKTPYYISRNDRDAQLGRATLKP